MLMNDNTARKLFGMINGYAVKHSKVDVQNVDMVPVNNFL